MLKRPKQRLVTFVSAQVAILLGIFATFYLMNCSYMLTFYLYLAYVIISTVLIFGVVRYYDRIMIKRLDAKPASDIINWPQEFVDSLALAKLYYFDSAVPRAFAAGKSIFVSIGLLEILNDDELKAVLAHEAWHIRNNSRTPFLKQLALMTFSSHSESELEYMADCFAAEIAGSEALFSARNKLDKVFT
ncbi:MAG: M48 family metalloprotease [Candidatus Methanoperedens sp.]|nr:M48 family metalloprotease [Candidatus Methanoperedens sp.]